MTYAENEEIPIAFTRDQWAQIVVALHYTRSATGRDDYSMIADVIRVHIHQEEFNHGNP